MSNTPEQAYRLAINGYGRIGRCFLRALHEAGLFTRLPVVAINEPADLKSISYLTRFDSTHGRFPGRVETAAEQLRIDDHSIAVSHENSPEAVDWRAQDVDLLVECSGQYGERAQLQRFINAGCRRVLLSHPGHSAADVDATIVFGHNHKQLGLCPHIVSSASCTTNAVVPVLALIERELGIDQVLLSTLHAAMNDQPLIDGYHHHDLRRTRSAMQSIIPVSTGLARGVERLLPQLAGKVQAKAIRVPTHNVSAIDMVISVNKDIDRNGLNRLLHMATQGAHNGLLAYSEEAHASIDFNHDHHSAIIDGSQTHVSGQRLINLLVWFDNEWGFASRMVDVARYWLTHATGHAG